MSSSKRDAAERLEEHRVERVPRAMSVALEVISELRARERARQAAWADRLAEVLSAIPRDPDDDDQRL